MVGWWNWGALLPRVKAWALSPPLGRNFSSSALVGPGRAHHTDPSMPPLAGEQSMCSMLPPQDTTANKSMPRAGNVYTCVHVCPRAKDLNASEPMHRQGC